MAFSSIIMLPLLLLFLAIWAGLIYLLILLIRALRKYLRGGEARTAELGEGLRRTEGGRWGSGRLLAALEEWLGRRSVEGADWRERSRAAESNRQKLGRLLLKLFEWIRRELHADNHRD